MKNSLSSQTEAESAIVKAGSFPESLWFDLAGCEDAERTSLSHMAVFTIAAAESTRAAFAHNFTDSSHPERRLERISHFAGGDCRIIDRGMKVLVLAMLADHTHDAKEDLKRKKMNPVGAGHWDAGTMAEDIRRDLDAVPCPEMDAILNPDRPPTFWDK